MWMNAFVSLLPVVALLGLFIFLMAPMRKNSRKALEIREQEASQIRQTLEELVVPEVRGIRIAVEAATAELRNARVTSEANLRK